MPLFKEGPDKDEFSEPKDPYQGREGREEREEREEREGRKGRERQGNEDGERPIEEGDNRRGRGSRGFAPEDWNSPTRHPEQERDVGSGSGKPPERRPIHEMDLGASVALPEQLHEELSFQEERAAPGEDLGWEEYGMSPLPPSIAPTEVIAPLSSIEERRVGERRGATRRGKTPTAGDLMTPNPEVVTGEMSLAEAARRMRDLDVGMIPVVDDIEGRHLKGVITDRDIAIRAVAADRTGTERVGDFMTPTVAVCHPDDRMREVLHVMEREQIRRVPIVDHAGSIVGIIAQADLAVNFTDQNLRLEGRIEQVIERISEPARPRREGL